MGTNQYILDTGGISTGEVLGMCMGFKPNKFGYKKCGKRINRNGWVEVSSENLAAQQNQEKYKAISYPIKSKQ